MTSARTRFTPKAGEVYENQGGGPYLCTHTQAAAPFSAEMQNTKSGWTFTAKGVGIYEDGRIDWDYSVGGRFEKIRERRNA